MFYIVDYENGKMYIHEHWVNYLKMDKGEGDGFKTVLYRRLTRRHPEVSSIGSHSLLWRLGNCQKEIFS